MKRGALIVALVIFAGCAQPPEVVVDKQAFEPVHHAAIAVTAATSVGVTCIRMMDLVQQFATEVTAAKTRTLNDREQLMMEKYQSALAIYVTSLGQWKDAIAAGVENKPMQRSWGDASGIIDDANLIFENKLKPMSVP